MKKVYLVRQTQPDNYIDELTIAVFDKFEPARDLARALNKEYGNDCVFNDDWDFIEPGCNDDLHYYDVVEKTLNPDPKQFLQ